VRTPVGTSRFVVPPPFPYSGRRREAKQVNRPGSCWVEVCPPHTGRLSAGAAHSSETPRWEPGGQDWLSASGTFGRCSGHPTPQLDPFDETGRSGSTHREKCVVAQRPWTILHPPIAEGTP
jgi:hypothetical protein